MTTTNKQLNVPAFNTPNWDVPLNSNFQIIDKAFGSVQTVSPTAPNTFTLSSTDIQYGQIVLSGAITGTATATIPAGYSGYWIIYNNTSGAYTLNVKTLTGAVNIAIAQGYRTIICSNGTECSEAVSAKFNTTGGTVSGNLAVTGTVNVGTGKLTYDPSAGTPQLYVTGTIYATSNITAFSDERLKNNISTIEDALNLVNQMRGVRFEDKDGNKYVGLIAQELQKVVPEAVVVHEESGYLAVAYQNIVGVLVNAINELSDRVKKLEEK